MPRKNRAVLLAALALCLSATAAWSGDAEPVRTLAVQDRGRVKAFDSFSRETVETITGKERWEKKDAAVLVLELLGKPSSIADLPWILAGSASLRKELGLSPEKRHFSYNEIFPSLPKIEALLQNARTSRELDKPVHALEKEAETLYERLLTVKELAAGDSLNVLPPADGKTEAWRPSERFMEIASLYAKNEGKEFESAVADWKASVSEATHGAHTRTLELEVLYLKLRPFQWAWVFYLAAFILLTAFKQKHLLRTAGVGLILLAMAFHTLGLVLRVLVLQRPPVSNMYESMVYMNWAVMVFAAAFAAGRRNLVYLSAGSAVSALVMIYGNLLPIDSDLELLVPVLRSNYWLTVHVMTIVSSYGAFGLAMALGHRHLFMELTGKMTKAARESSAELIDGVIKLGVLLLGIGTVLGGVWANESWGRFWGWDPKETWALITFLAYLVVVHLKYSKKIDAHWLAVSSVLGFFFVLMTWYGVNFVLGRGLHSYGFGSGGMAWIAYYVIAELVFLALVLAKTPAGTRRA